MGLTPHIFSCLSSDRSGDRSDRRCDKSDRREAFLLKNHAKLTYFHLIFPSFQYYAALIYTWNPIYVEYISDVINKADALPTN